MDDILFITAFKDIGRSNWTTHKRTNEEYFSYFLNITNNIKYKLIVYLDDEIKDNLLLKYNFNEKIITDDRIFNILKISYSILDMRYGDKLYKGKIDNNKKLAKY